MICPNPVRREGGGYGSGIKNQGTGLVKFHKLFMLDRDYI